MKEIPLLNGGVALVDDEDYALVSQYHWSAYRSGKTSYAVARRNQKHLRMHILLMGKVPGFDIDHTDRNGLNNTRANLRRCTRSQNNANSTVKRPGRRFKGVFRHSQCPHLWYAIIVCNRKRKYLGIFSTEEDGARAYDKAAIELYGEFARLNFNNGLCASASPA